MIFERALKSLKEGYKVRRKVWAPKLYIEILTDIKGYRIIRGFRFGGGGDGIHYTFEQLDILAEDWEIL